VPGYLRHIAAKVNGNAPVLRPRVPSLFEPMGGGGILRTPEEVAEVTAPSSPEPSRGWSEAAGVAKDDSRALRATESVQQQRSAAEPSRTAAEPIAVHTQQATSASEPRRDDSASEPGRTSFEHERRVEVSPRQERTARELATPSTVQSEARNAVGEMSPEANRRALPVETTLVRESEAIHAQPRMRTLPVARAEEAAAEPIAERSDTRPEQHPRAADGLRAAIEQIGQFVSAPRAAPPPVPVATSAAKPAAMRAESRDEPAAIQVSIGRVIVEAVMPPAAPAPLPARPAPGPRLSLDDYLRQRGGRA
jgi:hypothetical protein